MRMFQKNAVWVVAGGLMLIPASVGWGQQRTGLGNSQSGGVGSTQNGGLGTGRSGAPVNQTPSISPLGPITNDLPRNQQMEQEQAKMRNLDRQKKLMADTDKLLALATELKAQVEKSNKDTLSLDVVKKADEIEKLAHNVKEKMKGS